MATIFGDMIRRSYKDEVRKEDQTTSTVKITKFYNGITILFQKLDGHRLQSNTMYFKFNYKFQDERTTRYYYMSYGLIFEDCTKEFARTTVEGLINETLQEMGGHIDGYDINELKRGDIELSKSQKEFNDRIEKKINEINSQFYID